MKKILFIIIIVAAAYFANAQSQQFKVGETYKTDSLSVKLLKPFYNKKGKFVYVAFWSVFIQKDTFQLETLLTEKELINLLNTK